jgi:glycerophosphoryl diester phosphodiesterase
MPEKSALIIAHRGESFDAPENTMAAINLAWERGAEAVEIDVHLSKDNEVVVFHDVNTKRVAGVDKKIAAQNLR